MGDLEKYRTLHADKTNEELEVIARAAPKTSEEHSGAANVLIERRKSEAEQMTVEDSLRLRSNLDNGIFNAQLAIWIATTIAITILIFVLTWVLFF